uniref:Protein kinase domain-containing protein n=1 Tax=Rhabditophanes sp. KR3021 TaxID=114890 RepID=A0AC35TH25_9BILA
MLSGNSFRVVDTLPTLADGFDINNVATIVKYLSNGRYGKIYQAKLTATGQDVCLKVGSAKCNGLVEEWFIYDHFLTKTMFDADNLRVGRDFLGLPERIASGFNRDGNPIDDWLRYIAMPLYPETLEHHRKERRVKNILKNEIRSMGNCLLNALEYLHSKNVTHNDIRPGNIMLLVSGNLDKVVLCGMSLADYQSNVRTSPPNQANVGALDYRSLDAHENVRGSYRSDIQNLGLNMIDWLLGYVPWKNDNFNAGDVYNYKKQFIQDMDEDMDNLAPFEETAFIEDLINVSMRVKYGDKMDFAGLKAIFNSDIRAENSYTEVLARPPLPTSTIQTPTFSIPFPPTSQNMNTFRPPSLFSLPTTNPYLRNFATTQNVSSFCTGLCGPIQQVAPVRSSLYWNNFLPPQTFVPFFGGARVPLSQRTNTQGTSNSVTTIPRLRRSLRRRVKKTVGRIGKRKSARLAKLPAKSFTKFFFKK